MVNPILCQGLYDPAVVVNIEVAVPGQSFIVDPVLPPMKVSPDGMLAPAPTIYIQKWDPDAGKYVSVERPKHPPVPCYPSSGPSRPSIEAKLDSS